MAPTTHLCSCSSYPPFRFGIPHFSLSCRVLQGTSLIPLTLMTRLYHSQAPQTQPLQIQRAVNIICRIISPQLFPSLVDAIILYSTTSHCSTPVFSAVLCCAICCAISHYRLAVLLSISLLYVAGIVDQFIIPSASLFPSVLISRLLCTHTSNFRF